MASSRPLFQDCLPQVIADEVWGSVCRIMLVSGQSLVVWAINEGRLAADQINSFMANSPSKENALPSQL